MSSEFDVGDQATVVISILHEAAEVSAAVSSAIRTPWILYQTNAKYVRRVNSDCPAMRLLEIRHKFSCEQM